MSTETQCVRCGRPMADQAYACSSCGYRAGDQLHDIADMAPAARDIAHGLAHHGRGGTSGKPGSRLPFDLGATQKLNRVAFVLVEKWLKPIARERGYAGVIYDAAARNSDPIVVAATWLAGQVEWMRHRQEADEFLAAVDSCLRVVRSIARGPAEQKYLGPCGADLVDDDPPDDVYAGCPNTGRCLASWDCHAGNCKPQPAPTCEGDVYAYRGSRVGRCRTCGAEVATGDREAWLDGEVRSRAFRASEIANAYGVNVKTIRTWHARGLLAAHGHDPAGTPQFNVGEVLDLAAADAARRATEQAKRARRRERAADEDGRLSA